MPTATDISSIHDERPILVPSAATNIPSSKPTDVTLSLNRTPSIAPARGSSDHDVEPTEWELANLRRVGESLHPAIFLVAVAETAERFIYRCMTGPLRTCDTGD